ncbi:hypothetical protein HY484_04130 [Candidatus Woesearchaeota archaeon]|nr:hypothetical protein [Candidatus Woesearchaeota archaeon]
MRNTVKGIIEIPKLLQETENNYKTAIAERLYDLLVAYHAEAKEINESKENDYDSSARYSRMCQEPQTPEPDALPHYDGATHDAFANHHFLYGWNKTLPFENFGSHEQTDDETSHAGDFVHWIRTTENGERIQFDAYLIKHHEHPVINNNGVMLFNGVMFAEKYKFSTYQKIKNVLMTFRRVLLAHERPFTDMRIQLPTATEIFAYNQETGKLEWMLEER